MSRWWVWTQSLLTSFTFAMTAVRAQSSSLDGQDEPTSEHREIDLSWRAPVECPDEADVEREIRRLLANSSDHQAIAVSMVVVRESGGVFSLGVDLRAPVLGNRSLEHADCGAVTRAAALVVALAIDAEAVAVASERGSSSEVVAVAPEKPPSSLSEKPKSAAKDEREQPAKVAWGTTADDEVRPLSSDSWSAHVALGAHVEATFSPGAAWGPLLAFGVGNRWFEAELLVGGIPGYVVTHPSSSVEATFEALWLEADACAGMLRRVVNVALCVAGREYWIRATGRGVDEVLKPTTAVFAMAGGPMLGVELGSWRLQAVFQGVVPFARPSFVVDNVDGTLFRPSTIGLSGRLALSLTL